MFTNKIKEELKKNIDNLSKNNLYKLLGYSDRLIDESKK